MLDMNFVRDHLPQVEEKLRQRGTDAAEVLKDFAAIDAERRQAITAVEALQARRNRASEEIAKLKKSGQDASTQINETKELREQIQESEKRAAEHEARLREILTAIPNLPHDSVPIGKSAEDNVEARRWEELLADVGRFDPVFVRDVDHGDLVADLPAIAQLLEDVNHSRGILGDRAVGEEQSRIFLDELRAQVGDAGYRDLRIAELGEMSAP